MVRTVQQITAATQFPTIKNIYQKCGLGRTRNIIKDASHPNHGPFPLLPSGKH